MRKYLAIEKPKVTYLWEGSDEVEVNKNSDGSTVKIIHLESLFEHAPQSVEDWHWVRQEIFKIVERDHRRNIYDFEGSGFGYIVERA